MTRLDPGHIAYYWEHNLGSPFAVVPAVAVALAESGGDTNAVSPSDDHGLWQINRIHFGALGLNDRNVYDPNVNAWAAIQVSNRGRNWAPWCTAWVNPGRDCGHGQLSVPQEGSPAGSNLLYVAHTLNVQGVAAGPVGPPPSAANQDAAAGAWGDVQRFLGGDAATRYNRMQSIGNAAKGTRT